MLKVIMYDEPTAGLDPVASTVVEDLIRELHDRKAAGANGSSHGGIASYIVVTHQQSTIRRAVDRIIFLHAVCRMPLPMLESDMRGRGFWPPFLGLLLGQCTCWLLPLHSAMHPTVRYDVLTERHPSIQPLGAELDFTISPPICCQFFMVV